MDLQRRRPHTLAAGSCERSTTSMRVASAADVWLEQRAEAKLFDSASSAVDAATGRGSRQDRAFCTTPMALIPRTPRSRRTLSCDVAAKKRLHSQPLRRAGGVKRKPRGNSCVIRRIDAQRSRVFFFVLPV